MRRCIGWRIAASDCCLLLLLGATPVTLVTAGPTPVATVFERDVDFLLGEFEQQAGHFFPLKKIDWKATAKEFRAAARKVKSNDEHVKLCGRLLARLKDGHAAITDLKLKLEDEARGRRWTGPRVLLVTNKDRVYVRASFKNARSQGIEPGMEVVKIDGVPARQWLGRRIVELGDRGNSYSTEHQALHAACHWGLADWEGKPITFELRVKGGTKKVSVVRSGGPNFAPLGPAFPPEPLLSVGRQAYGKTASGLGYIHLRDVPGDLPEQLDAALEGLGDVPGLILDLRANGGGGCDHEAVFGRFLAPGERWRQYTALGKKGFSGPMVVLIDAGVRSAGETVAGMLKEDGRAYLIGDTPTAGMSSQKASVTVPSGLFSVRFSVHSNKARFNDGKGIEGLGVPPHEIVLLDPTHLAWGKDSLILRAEELLKQGLPGKVVPYSTRAGK